MTMFRWPQCSIYGCFGLTSVTAARCSRTGHIPWKSAVFPWEGRGAAEQQGRKSRGDRPKVLVIEIVMCPQ